MLALLLWRATGTAFPHGERIKASEGALLFVLPHEGNAITAATGEADHVGIAHHIGGDQGLLYVIEAIGQGVSMTPIDSFLVHNSEADIIVKEVPKLDVARSVRNALHYVGRPYDWNYTPGDSALYCSELVQLCYVNIDGHPVFGTTPMRFSDAEGCILPYWADHYGRQGIPVPEGAPGTNPTQLLLHLAPPQ